MYKYLDKVNSPRDIKNMTVDEFVQKYTDIYNEGTCQEH